MLTETLENGLRVAVCGRRGLESAGMSFHVGYGGLSEPKSIMGVAHFLEHLLFDGTKKRSAKDLREAFLTTGIYWNGVTNFDCTRYDLHCHRNFFGKALGILSDITQNSTLGSESVENERKTILSEISKWATNQEVLLSYRVAASLFRNERFNHLIQGTEETVGRIRQEDLSESYGENYGPKNAYLAIYGAVDERRALGLAEKLFSEHSGESVRKKSIQVERRAKAKHMTFRQKGTAEATIALTFDTSRFSSIGKIGKKVATDVLARILDNRLRNELREKRGLAYSMYASHRTFAQFGFIECSAGVRANDAKLAKKVMLDECEKLGKGEVGKEEVDKTKINLLILRKLSFENSLSIATGMSYFGLFGAPDFLTSYLKILKSISLDEVRSAALECLDTEDCGTVSFLPKIGR